MRSTVYKLSVDFQAGGVKFGVSSIAISLAANVIPSYRVLVSLYDQGVTKVQAGDILTDVKQYGQQMKNKTANLTVRLVPIDGGGKPQIIQLKNWIVKGVGLDQLDAGGGIQMSMQVEHPACLLDTAVPGIIVQTRAGDDPTGFKSANNMLHAAANAFELWGKNQVSGNDGKAKVLAQRLLKTTQLIPAYMTFASSGSNFPLTDILGSKAGEHFTRTCYNTVKGLGEQGQVTSVWACLTSTFVGPMHLTLSPTYDVAKLVVKPFEPWGPVAYVVETGDIINMAMPATDPSPVAGTRISFSSFDTPYTPPSWHSNKKMSDDFVGAPRLDEIELSEEAEGQLLGIRCPAWLQPLDLAQLEKSDSSFFYDEEADPDDQQEKLIEQQKKQDALLSQAGKRLARAEYLAWYRQSTQISFHSRLLLATEGGGILYPGARVRLDRTDGESLISFYATEVKHVIDVAGGTAYTDWQGGYLALSASDTKLVGSYNPLYTKK